MVKLIALVLAALMAIVSARPGYLASSPVFYNSHVVQPVVRAHYAAVPVVKHIVTPVVHHVATPVVHTVAVPVVHSVRHSYAAVPLARSYSSAYVPFKKH